MKMTWENVKLAFLLIVAVLALMWMLDLASMGKCAVQRAMHPNDKTLVKPFPSSDERRVACFRHSFERGYGITEDDELSKKVWGHDREETLREMKAHGLSCRGEFNKRHLRRFFNANGVRDPKLKAFFAKRQAQIEATAFKGLVGPLP